MPSTEINQAEKKNAALFSVVAAAGITALKLLTGVLTGSLGMLSEGAHSAIDLIAAAITLFSISVSDQPADEEHNYGHGKIESLSAFFETVLMLGSCIWIVTEAVRRILFGHHLVLAVSVWPFLVLALSITVDYSRSRALLRAAREHRSLALEADAVHFRTDIWSSLAVFAGLLASALGKHYGIPQLEYADPIAAILVSAIILRVTWRLARQTIDNLLDATPIVDERSHSRRRSSQELIRELAKIKGVVKVERLRIRQSGPRFFADITIGMSRNLTFQRTEQLTVAATEVVQRHLPGADVVVQSVPTASGEESLHDRIRAVAASSNLAIHDVSIQRFDHKLHIEQHLEVDETMPLRRAHEVVTELETEMHREIPEISSILTHIESEPATIEQPASLERNRQTEVLLRDVAGKFPEILDIHDVLVTRNSSLSRDGGGDRVQVNCHATLPDDLAMARVHAVITGLENAFKIASPEVDRLLIHPEPATDNRR